MLLTQLDGYLTGTLVSPDMVPPGGWLKHIWAGDDGVGVPHFEKMDDFQLHAGPQGIGYYCRVYRPARVGYDQGDIA